MGHAGEGAGEDRGDGKADFEQVWVSAGFAGCGGADGVVEAGGVVVHGMGVREGGWRGTGFYLDGEEVCEGDEGSWEMKKALKNQ